MPRKSKRGGDSAAAPPGGPVPRNEMGDSDDESVFNDDASMVSNASSSNNYEDEGGKEEDAEVLKEDKLRDLLTDDIELSQQKSVQGRVDALKRMEQTFTKLYAPTFVGERILTIGSIVKRALHRGKDAEKLASARLSSAFYLQLESSQDVESAFDDLQPELAAILADKSASYGLRAAAANSLALGCFLCNDAQRLEPVLQALEKVFSGSLSTVDAKWLEAAAPLHTAALTSWALLTTLITRARSFDLLESHLELFNTLLDAPDVDLRIAAGETVALLFEDAQHVEVDEASEDAVGLVSGLLDKMQGLARDSAKYRSKKDRKEQRSVFRDVLNFVKFRETDFESVTIHSDDVLYLESWGMKRRYDQICQVLTSGMRYHLADNVLLREVFGLGAPVLRSENAKLTRKQKAIRQKEKQVVFRARNQARDKARSQKGAM